MRTDTLPARLAFGLLCVITLALWPDNADASVNSTFAFFQEASESEDMNPILRTFLILTALSFIPLSAIALTAFTRIIVVLALMRHALGLQQTPPNSVLITLAMFLTLFTMLPTLGAVRDQAYEPYLAGDLDTEEALQEGIEPLKAFMIRQTREQDLAVILEIGKAEQPETVDDIQVLHLVPAFMLSELKTAFQMGFAIFLPFLMIDLVVAAILMSLGMIMVPPIAISLPIKILVFVLVDGWSLVLQTLLVSFGGG